MTEELPSLPHAADIETSVLSVVINQPELMDEIPHGSELFYLPAHRILIEQMREMGPTLEILSLAQRLKDRGLFEKAGGGDLLSGLWANNPGAKVLERHLPTLLDRYARRLAIAAATAASHAAHDCRGGGDSPGYLEAIGEPFQRVFEIAAGLKPIPSSKDLANEFKEDFRALYEGRKLPMGIPTGIFEIDDPLRGLHEGHMGVISAFSGGGKSTLATQVLCNVGSDGIPVAYFPMEGTMKSHFRRCVIQLSRLPHATITAPASKPVEGEFRAIKRAIAHLESGCFHFEKPSSRHVSAVLAGIRRSVRKHGTKVAVVDYLQLMRGQRQKGDTGEREFADISHAVQELADSLHITIIVLSQQNADGETKHARAIEEDCDFWLSVVQHRDRESEDFKRHKHVQLVKDRHNSRDGEILPLILDREHVRFIRGSWEPEKKRKTGRASFGDN
jgi:replicative DNA helicase